MTPYATDEMIWAHLAEVRRRARANGWHPLLCSVERRPVRVALGEALVGLGLRLMAVPGLRLTREQPCPPAPAAMPARR